MASIEFTYFNNKNMGNSVDVTVAIRTYNAEKTLRSVLEKLRDQVDAESFSWEVVVVDNNSTDGTLGIIKDFQVRWFLDKPFRYCIESKQGASFSRRRAMAEAEGDLVAFLDDDNIPGSNWLAAVYRFGCAYPDAGAYGGRISGRYQSEPPKGFERIASFLAIKERGDEPLLYDPAILSLPAGAGLVIRKRAWAESIPAKQSLLGPVEGALNVKGEDYEALVHIATAGWKIWYNPDMVIYHEIPACRLERDYLMTVMRGTGLNVFYLRTISLKEWKKPIVAVKIVLGSLRRIFWHVIRHRFDVTQTVPACELFFQWNTLLSPFHFWAMSKRNRRFC